ncbi:Thioredoxin domain-containing protein 17 [Hondaea fermentalgiana]|uniref:Thioredoxin domain-containing protein 17 n=1 Tax=Hondaea fermentalgiana TaxID=2315210 RepID=A0A2R5GR24_9STRA|nr:Thioredoxin domain-containing protein 17 [Hondaea fermentalgiana]|eukprot:GBG32208.1 Thioredoxin domain-containing protein 17 [Hondaea fermentalgiana]
MYSKEDGTRWCPDCEESDPILQEATEHAPAAVQFIEVELTRDEWKVDPGAEHFLRKEPYNVTGIPTMMLWNPTEKKCEKRFNEADLVQLENVSEFFRRFATDRDA